MKDFIYKLVARLTDEQNPLSRNRHFHTFDNPDGRKALKISRQLRALARDIVAQAKSGQPLRLGWIKEGEEVVRVQIDFVKLKATRTAFITPIELELLLRRDDVKKALETAQQAA